MSEIVLYSDSTEYLYASITAFEVDGTAVDPTDYAAEVAIVEPDETVGESDWVDAVWVKVGTTDRVRVLTGNQALPLVAGHYSVYVRLTGNVETIIRQAGRLTVRDL
jgi:hypothetical protein